jgi:pimeloyl-ACP methyl ester carboxylesterase
MITAKKSTYAAVNGLELYYEIHGSGKPLILLHGGIMASNVFGSNIEALAQNQQVISVHLQCHGHTRDIDRPLRYESMADDIAALIAYLKLEKVDIMGYSLGGGVALQTVIRHPKLVDRLVVITHTMSHDGWYPEVLAEFE